MNDVTDRSIETQLRAWADDLADRVPAHLPSDLDLTRRPSGGRSDRTRWLVAAVVVFVAGAGTVVVANRDRSDVMSDDVRSDPTHADAGWEATELMMDSARIGVDGRTLTLEFVGGPEYDADDPCTVDYRALVEETTTEVRVHLEERVPPTDLTEVACESMGYFRSAVAELDRPLGDRIVRHEPSGSGVPVADERTIARVESLPDDWVREEPAATFAGRWQHRFELQADAGTCGTLAVMLYQGPQSMLDEIEPYGRRATSERTIRGNRAEYWRGGSFPTSQLRWIENGQGLILSSDAACERSEPASLGQLVDLAQALRIPPS